jgi:adenylate cyclase
VTEQPVQRRLAAILAADAVGYSALLQHAQEATYAARIDCAQPLPPRRATYQDGGGWRARRVASPLAAMRCAVEIQDHLASRGSHLRLRVGRNLGDVIVGQDGDLHGNGILTAARLERIIDPTGILISEKVYREVEGGLDVGFEDRGEPARYIERVPRGPACG